ncbi:MAG TPA: LamG domain-containing protein [Halanaerobiales bacterium]|nr:LamG domain-containing protein [Halanaerobiales bacterium]
MKNYTKLLIILFLILGGLFATSFVYAGTISKPSNNLGLVGYWSMDEGRGNTVSDFSGNGNDGTLEGDPQWVDGRHGKALDFDGSSDYVAIDNLYYNSGGEIPYLTVSAWVKIPEGGGSWSILDYDRSEYFTFAEGRLVTDGTVEFDTTSSGGSVDDFGGTTNIEDGNWHHVAAVFDSSDTNDKKIYVDGELDNEKNAYGDGVALGTGVTRYGFIGDGSEASSFDGGRNSLYYQGKVDEIRLYHRALSDSEIQDLYNRGLAKITQPDRTGLVAHWKFDEGRGQTTGDSSFNTNSGTLNLGTSGNTSVANAWTDGRYGQALQLDGSGTVDGTTYGDHVEIPESITRTDNYPDGVTYSIWLKADNDAVDRMALFRGASTIRHIEIYSDSKKFRTEAAKQNGYSFGTGNFPDEIKGKWSHFTIVFANNEANRPVRWYQNGTLFYTGDMTSGDYPDTEYFSFGSIGRSTGNTSYTYAKSFDGTIDDVRIYSKALTEDEIEGLYESTQHKVNVSQNNKLTDGLVGMWSFDGPDLSGSTANDVSGNSNDGTLNGEPQPVIGKIGQALEFDGDYIQLPSSLENELDGNPEATLSMWIKLNSDQNSASNSGIIQLSGYDNSNGNLYYYHDSSREGGIWLDVFRTNRVFTGDWQPSFPGIVWHNLVVTTSPGTNGWKMYLNGDLKYQTTGQSEVSVKSSLFGGFRVGQNSGGRSLRGKIDNVRIYNRALSQKEIQRLYRIGR